MLRSLNETELEKAVYRIIIPRDSRENILELLTEISNAILIPIELRNFACDSNMKQPFILQLHHSDIDV